MFQTVNVCSGCHGMFGLQPRMKAPLTGVVRIFTQDKCCSSGQSWRAPFGRLVSSYDFICFKDSTCKQNPKYPEMKSKSQHQQSKMFADLGKHTLSFFFFKGKLSQEKIFKRIEFGKHFQMAGITYNGLVYWVISVGYINVILYFRYGISMVFFLRLIVFMPGLELSGQLQANKCNWLSFVSFGRNKFTVD